MLENGPEYMPHKAGSSKANDSSGQQIEISNVINAEPTKIATGEYKITWTTTWLHLLTSTTLSEYEHNLNKN